MAEGSKLKGVFKKVDKNWLFADFFPYESWAAPNEICKSEAQEK